MLLRACCLGIPVLYIHVIVRDVRFMYVLFTVYYNDRQSLQLVTATIYVWHVQHDKMVCCWETKLSEVVSMTSPLKVKHGLIVSATCKQIFVWRSNSAAAEQVQCCITPVRKITYCCDVDVELDILVAGMHDAPEDWSDELFEGELALNFAFGLCRPVNYST